MRSGFGKRLSLPVLFFIAFAAILYVSRPHLDQFPQLGRNYGKSQTPQGMDPSMERDALAQVSESADMTFPLFDYTYDKIATLSSEKRKSKDPCMDVLLPNGGTEARSGEGTRVLVTGGAGFIGSNLVDRLLQLGYKVRIYDNLYTGFLRNVPLDNPDVEFVLGDILNHTALDAAMKDIDYVYHLAAMSKVVPSLKDPDMARFCTEANALGSWNVLDSVRNQGHIKKVIYAASSTYYGNHMPPHREDMAADFLTPYAASKYEGEIQMQMFDRLFGVPTVSTRFFMVYGPRQPSTGAYAIVTGVFAKQAADNKPLTIEGDGTHYRDFIHVHDIVEGMIISQQMVDLRGETINLGSGTAFSVNDVASLISSNQVHVDPRPNDLEGTLADTCKMKRLLNYRAKADFKKEMGYMAKETMNGNVFMQSWMEPMMALAAPHLLAPGTPVFNWPKDATDLDALLLAMKHVDRAGQGNQHVESSRVSVVVFSTTEEYAEDRINVLLNTVFTLVRFGAVRQYLIAAVDATAVETCKALNMPCYDARAQKVPTLLKELISRGKDVHLARFGNSYIGSVEDFLEEQKDRHQKADVIGASPYGDVFVLANDRARSAMREWAEGEDALSLHEPNAVDALHNIRKWPAMKLNAATFNAERVCNKADYDALTANATSAAAPAATATGTAEAKASKPAEAKVPEPASGDKELPKRSLVKRLETDKDDDDEDDEDEDDEEEEEPKDKHARPYEDKIIGDDDEPAKASPTSKPARPTLGPKPGEAECVSNFYRAIGCEASARLPAPPQLISDLRAVHAWHLTSCPSKKHCDRQQIVPKRWVQPTPDLTETGGLC